MQPEITTTNIVSLFCLFLGLLLTIFHRPIARVAVILYKKMGFEVPEEKYARQFMWVGLILLILGFLVSTGLIDLI